MRSSDPKNSTYYRYAMQDLEEPGFMDSGVLRISSPLSGISLKIFSALAVD
jgi:hypothetical protein